DVCSADLSGADQGVQTALGVADVGDAVSTVDGQRVNGGGAQGADLPLIRSQRLVHGAAVGEVDRLDLEAVGFVQLVLDHVLNGQRVQERHDRNLQRGQIPSVAGCLGAAGLTGDAGGGAAGIAAAGCQGKRHNAGQEKRGKFLQF